MPLVLATRAEWRLETRLEIKVSKYFDAVEFWDDSLRGSGPPHRVSVQFSPFGTAWPITEGRLR